MNAEPGDLVVCVNAAPKPSFTYHPWPLRRGSVWRVSWAGFTPKGNQVYRLEGDGPFPADKMGWSAHRFRKLNDEPDNAEIIARIKNPVRIGEPA